LAIALLALGLIMVLSASSVTSIAQYGSPWSVFERQVMWSAIGAIAFICASRINVALWRRLAVPMLGAAAFLLLLVLVHGVGTVAGGSSRWINLGPFTLQPSEFAKLAFSFFAADLVARRESSGHPVRDVVRPLVLVLCFLAALILRQPDMGTAVVLVCISLAVLYAAGIEARILGPGIGIVALAGVVFTFSSGYRRARLLSFINPFAHASTSGYQIVQSLVALGSGHLTGTGVGGSVATWGLLPNAQTDFIFAIIGNELGLIGACLVIASFACFGWLGIRIAARATDRFSSFLAAGLTCWIICQAFINIGGVVGVLPDTGIPLPFLSFGGSSLVVVLGATGILVNIARHPKSSYETMTHHDRSRRQKAAMSSRGVRAR
jgi:cell division protein FtsW